MSSNEPPIAGGDFPTDPPGAYRDEGGGFDVNARILRGHETLVRQLGILHQHYQTVVKDLRQVKDELKEIGDLDFGLNGGGGGSFISMPKMPAPALSKEHQERAGAPVDPTPGTPQQRQGNGGWGDRLKTAGGLAAGAAAGVVGAAGFWFNNAAPGAVDRDQMQRYAAMGGTSAGQFDRNMRQNMTQFGGTLDSHLAYRQGFRSQGIIPGTHLSERLSREASRYDRLFPDMSEEDVAGVLGQFHAGPTAARLAQRGIRTGTTQDTSSIIQGSIQQAWRGRTPTMDQLRSVNPGTLQYQHLTQLFGGNEQMTQFALQHEMARRSPGGFQALGETALSREYKDEGARGRRDLETADEIVNAYKTQNELHARMNTTLEGLAARFEGISQALAHAGGTGGSIFNAVNSPAGAVATLGAGKLLKWGMGRFGFGAAASAAGGGAGAAAGAGGAAAPVAGTTAAAGSLPFLGPIAGILGGAGGALLGGNLMRQWSGREGWQGGISDAMANSSMGKYLQGGRGLGEYFDYLMDEGSGNNQTGVWDRIKRSFRGSKFSRTGGVGPGRGVGDRPAGGGGAGQKASASSATSYSSYLMGRTDKEASHVTGLHPQLQQRLASMFRANPRLRINSGYRSVEHQKRLWDEAVAEYGSEAAARQWVAPPGKSNHNKGLAVDIGPKSEYGWLERHAPQFGLEPYVKEPWHWELKGTRSGQFDDWSPSEGAGAQVMGGDGASAPAGPAARSFLSLASFSQGSAASILGALGQGGGGAAPGPASRSVGGLGAGDGGGGGAAAAGGLGAFMAAIRRIESSDFAGDYDARGPLVTSGQYAGERAYGAYQIMPGNWPGWSKEAGVGGAPISSRAAQDAVARYKFQQYYQQYGSWEAAAVAWFAGGRAADKFVKGQDLSHINDAQPGHKGTSVPGYVDLLRQYMSQYSSQGVGDRATTSTTPPAPAPAPSSGGGGGTKSVTINLRLEKTTEADARKFARRVKAILQDEDRRDRIGAS